MVSVMIIHFSKLVNLSKGKSFIDNFKGGTGFFNVLIRVNLSKYLLMAEKQRINA